jgi:hypothetical protein
MSNEIEHITVEDDTRFNRDAMRNYKPQPAMSNRTIVHLEPLMRSWDNANETERNKLLEYIAE